MQEAGTGLTGYMMTAVRIFSLLGAAFVLTLILNFAFMAVVLGYFVATTGSLSQATGLFSDNISNMWLIIGLTVTQEIAWVIMPIVFIVLIERRRFSWSDLGLSFSPRAARLFLTGIAINALMGLAIIATILLTGWQHVEMNGLAEYGPAVVAGYLTMTVLLMLPVGIGEETLFRGYIQTDLMRKYGNIAALIVSSLAFAAIHIFFLIAGQEVSPLSIAGIFIASLVMGYLYIITGTIWASIGFHFFQDFLAAGVFLTGELPYVSYPLFLLSKSGDISMFGINLGSKDNLINILWLAVLMAALYVYQKKIRKPVTGK